MKYVVTLNGKNYEVSVEKGDAILESVTEAPVVVPVAPVAPVAPAAPAAPVAAPAAPVAAPAPAAPVAAASGTRVEAPMPGMVVSVKVAQGQAVHEGDVILVLEAMKMENEITAPVSGTIAQVATEKGKQVNSGELLFVIS